MSEVRRFLKGEEVEHQEYGTGLVISDLGDGRVFVKFFGACEDKDKELIICASQLTSHETPITDCEKQEPQAKPEAKTKILEFRAQIAKAPPPELLTRNDIQIIRNERGEITQVNTFVEDGEKFTPVEIWPGDLNEWVDMSGGTIPPNNLVEMPKAVEPENASTVSEPAEGHSPSLSLQFTDRGAVANVLDPLPALPAIFKSFSNWVTWEAVEPAELKRPRISGTVANASSKDSDTWVSYKTACENIAAGRGFKNLGFVTDGERAGNLTGLDIDGCRNPETGEITAWANQILKIVGNPYCEITPSGYGLRPWVTIALPKGNPPKVKLALDAGFGPKVGIEIFGDRQYCTISGNHLPGSSSDVLPLTEENLSKLSDHLDYLEARHPLPASERKKDEAKTPRTRVVVSNGVMRFELVPPDDGFKQLAKATGWKPLTDRMDRMDDTRFHEIEIAPGKMTYCPMPGHQPRSKDLRYSACFGAMKTKDGDEMVHCFGCGFSGDLVKTVRVFDAGEDGGHVQYETMYDVARAICKQENLKFEDFFPESSTNYLGSILQMKPQETQSSKSDSSDSSEPRGLKDWDEYCGPIDRTKLGEKRSIAWRLRDVVKNRESIMLWIGPSKSEKSLFALRFLYSMACGKDWMGYKNEAGPVKVFYADFENPKETVDFRLGCILSEFTEEEQQLIERNFVKFYGREYMMDGGDVTVVNDDLWSKIQTAAKGCAYVCLDPLYQMHEIPANKIEQIKKLMMGLSMMFGRTCLIFPHHTSRNTPDELGKNKIVGLKELGANLFAQKAVGGNTYIKVSDAILCQEKREEKDENGDKVGDIIFFQFFTRDGATSVMRIFETDYNAVKTNPLKRNLRRSLSNAAAQILAKLSKAPVQEWEDEEAVRQAASDGKRAGGRLYEAVRELIALAYLIRRGGQGPDQDYLILQRSEDVVDAVRTLPENKNVERWLFRLLGDGKTASTGLSLDVIKKAADAVGIAEKSLYNVRQRKPGAISSERRNGDTFWVLQKTSSKNSSKAA